MDDDLVLIQAGLVEDGLAKVLGVAGQSEGLGAAERGRRADLVLLVRVHLERILISTNGSPSDSSQHDHVAQDADRCNLLTPFSADFAAALACLEPALPLVPDHKNDASAIALSAVKELAKSAAAGMHRIVA